MREASLIPGARVYLRERVRVDQERPALGASLSTRWLGHAIDPWITLRPIRAMLTSGFGRTRPRHAIGTAI